MFWVKQAYKQPKTVQNTIKAGRESLFGTTNASLDPEPLEAGVLKCFREFLQPGFRLRPASPFVTCLESRLKNRQKKDKERRQKNRKTEKKKTEKDRK